MGDRVIALVADVVASRTINNRPTFDARLEDRVQRLNARRDRLLSPYTVTIGDEVQAVFGDAGGVFHDAISILAAIHPQKMRFSFGLGRLITPINPQRAIGMDGPAFYHARDGIDRLKQTGDLFDISGPGIPSLALARGSLRLVSHSMEGWQGNRFQILAQLQGGRPVKDIAAQLGISDKAVYKNRSVGALDVIISLFEEIEALLTAALGEGP